MFHRRVATARTSIKYAGERPSYGLAVVGAQGVAMSIPGRVVGAHPRALTPAPAHVPMRRWRSVADVHGFVVMNHGGAQCWDLKSFEIARCRVFPILQASTTAATLRQQTTLI